MREFSRRNAIALALGAAGGVFVLSSNAPADKALLAIRGYDAVAYFTLGKPVRGLPDIHYDWDEHRYHFASAEHRELFKADPARYAPQFAGFCTMALTRGELDEPNPEYWLVSDGKLYLFGKPIGPELFQRNLAENLAKANGNRSLTQRN